MPNPQNEIQKQLMSQFMTGIMQSMRAKKQRTQQAQQNQALYEQGLNDKNYENKLKYATDLSKSDNPQHQQMGFDMLKKLGVLDEVPQTAKPGTFFTPQETYEYEKTKRDLTLREIQSRIDRNLSGRKTGKTEQPPKLDMQRISEGIDLAEKVIKRLEAKHTIGKVMDDVSTWPKADQKKYQDAFTEMEGYGRMIQSGQGFNMLGPSPGLEGPSFIPQQQGNKKQQYIELRQRGYSKEEAMQQLGL